MVKDVNLNISNNEAKVILLSLIELKNKYIQSGEYMEYIDQVIIKLYQAGVNIFD